MRLGFSEEACAAVLASHTLSKGDPNALITPAELEKEKSRLLEKGSAFRRVISSGFERGVFRELAARGEMASLGKQLEIGANQHVVGTSQWIINRSLRNITQGGPLNRHMAADNLASIFTARELAVNPDAGLKIDAKAFREAKENVLNDPAFRKFADRYSSDADYRRKIDKDLSLDRTGFIISLEMYSLRNPQSQRAQRQNQAQNQQVQNQPNQRQDQNGPQDQRQPNHQPVQPQRQLVNN